MTFVYRQIFLQWDTKMLFNDTGESAKVSCRVEDNLQYVRTTSHYENTDSLIEK